MRESIVALKAEWGWKAARCYCPSGNTTAPNTVSAKKAPNGKLKKFKFKQQQQQKQHLCSSNNKPVLNLLIFTCGEFQVLSDVGVQLSVGKLRMTR